ncbi:MAG: hypothetical protein ACI9NC_002514, partial [Verrucomicrobiales bacterium]
MKSALILLVAIASTSALAQKPAEPNKPIGTIIFEDDFERIESQEQKDEPGKGWKTNSQTRAKGNKQVDLKDGAMRISIHEEADHGVSVVHDAEFTNGAV